MMEKRIRTPLGVCLGIVAVMACVAACTAGTPGAADPTQVRTYAVVSGGLALVDAKDGDVLSRIVNDRTGSFISSPSWASDGNRIAGSTIVSPSDGWAIGVFDAAGGTQDGGIVAPLGDSPAWRPNSNLIAFMQDASSERPQVVITNTFGRPWAKWQPTTGRWPTWSPDGTRLLYDAGGNWVIADVATGSSVKVPNHGFDHGFGDTVWSPDGRHVAFTGSSSGGAPAVGVLDLGTGTPVILARSASGPSWSPDGGRIAYLQRVEPWEADTWAVFVMNADGTNKHMLTDLGGSAAGGYSVAWSPDGSKIAVPILDDVTVSETVTDTDPPGGA